MHRSRYRYSVMALSVAILVGGGCAKEEPKVPDNPRKTSLDDFDARMKAYVAIRKPLVDSIGELDPTSSQDKIALRAVGLGKAIIAARANAKQGDLFAPNVVAILTSMIKEEYGARPDSIIEQRDDQQDEVPNFEPKVNELYPTSYPLATFPPKLLSLLPKLPDEVEYRIVRDALILRDIEANVILDFIPHAVPPQGS